MKTYLLLFHSSEGESPYIVMEKLTRIGFKPIQGHYDLEYDHGKHIEIDDIMSLASHVHETLRGCKVFYKLESVPLADL
ncbi:MAG: hypothetical protein ACXAD7_09655 [Candidatus Kariarchaeaceae archaeon]|jgi:hypothetical protein